MISNGTVYYGIVIRNTIFIEMHSYTFLTTCTHMIDFNDLKNVKKAS